MRSLPIDLVARPPSARAARAMICLSFGLLLSSAASAQAQPQYDFILVDSFNANPLAGEAYLWEINDVGTACGNATMDNVIGYPGFVWNEATGKTRVPVSNPLGVSNNGLVVGNQSVYDLHTAQSFSPPGLAGTYFGPSFGGVNDAGVAVGTISICSCSDSGGILRIPYVWDQVNGARTISVPNARGLSRINNAGVAIGWVNGWVSNDAFFVDLETNAYTMLNNVFPPSLGFGPTRAFEINDNGAIVGTRYGSAPVSFYGYVYSPTSGLQILPFPGAGYQQAVKPLGLNDNGTVVGEIYTTLASSRAFVYSASSGIHDLNDAAIVAGIPAGYTLGSAQKISDPGWIIGNGRTAAGKNTGCVLRPRAVACAADFDSNGTREVADIFAFLTAWFAGEPAAYEFGGTPGVPAIFAFLNAWFAGC